MIDDILFHEVQHSRQWWIWLIIVLVTAGSWYSFIGQVVIGTSITGNAASNFFIIVIWLLAGIILPGLFFFLKLDVTVRRDSINIRYFPILKRRYAARDIKQSFAREYRPLVEYGGWGIRWSPVSGWAYNTGGNLGVQLLLADGRKLLIGSQKPAELAAAIETMVGASGKSERKGKKGKSKLGRGHVA